MLPATLTGDMTQGDKIFHLSFQPYREVRPWNAVRKHLCSH